MRQMLTVKLQIDIEVAAELILSDLVPQPAKMQLSHSVFLLSTLLLTATSEPTTSASPGSILQVTYTSLPTDLASSIAFDISELQTQATTVSGFDEARKWQATATDVGSLTYPFGAGAVDPTDIATLASIVNLDMTASVPGEPTQAAFFFQAEASQKAKIINEDAKKVQEAGSGRKEVGAGAWALVALAFWML